MIRRIKKLFIQHPQNINETYYQHLKFTLQHAILLMKGSFVIIIHGFFPFLFLNTTRDLIKALANRFHKKSSIKHTKSILEYIGNTPLISLSYLNDLYPHINLYGKCEFLNPTLSLKDRIVLHMLKNYEERGLIQNGTVIYESSSGNTGASLAMIGKKLGYKIIITVPKKVSQEKIHSMRLLGAEVIICSDTKLDSLEYYVNKAKLLSEQDECGFYFNQYGEEQNLWAHYYTTAHEIWQQMEHNIDYVICPASSGGTISGIGRFLKEKDPKINIILADPEGSVFYDFFHGNELHPQTYQIEGAGKDRVCSIHDFSVINDVIQFNDEEAYQALKKIAYTDGLLVGGSAGGALSATEKLLASLPKDRKLNVAVILPDSGFKYLSKTSTAK